MKDLILMLINQKNLDDDKLKQIKKKYVTNKKLDKLPTNVQLLYEYRKIVKTGEINKNEELENLLIKRKIRSLSGVSVVQVLMKPWPCPGKCIFCPNDATMPKSYISTEPGPMRALLNDFDPIKQTWNRLLSLYFKGHPIDKIEMIVLGGTFDSYPKDYSLNFIKGLFDAANTFYEFLDKIDFIPNPKSAKFNIKDYNIIFSKNLDEAQEINQNLSKVKIIGLTIETRPEYVNEENIKFWRQLGVTRVEIGVQSCIDEVLHANKRGHTFEDIKRAFSLLRKWGLKITAHIMVGLYKSDINKDIESFRILFDELKPDEIKYYPLNLVPNTELYKLYKKGEYEPLKFEDLEYITNYVKDNIIPPWVRIKRVIRDIPSNEIVSGVKMTNFRQYILSKRLGLLKNDENYRKNLYSRLLKNIFTGDLKDFIGKEGTFVNGKIDIDSVRDFACVCTRCREIKHHKIDSENLVIRQYRVIDGMEYFITFETKLGYLIGLCRLFIPDKPFDYPGLGGGIVRELHVYGKEVPLNQEGNVQHKGYGKRLLKYAEYITYLNSYKKISVISGIGVRNYYKKLGYKLEGNYMVKYINEMDFNNYI